jgi:hypothetical protein
MSAPALTGMVPVPPKGSNLDRMCDAERRPLLGD